MNAQNPLQLALLGRFRLELGNQEIRLPTGKAMLVLSFLACERDRIARRERLASLFWPQADVEQARGSLRQTLSRLRASLGDERDAIWSDNEHIGLIPHAWSIDIDALHVCTGQDPTVVDRGWAAEFLAGMHRRDPSIDAWLEGEKQRHLQAVNRVFSAAIERSLQAGDPVRALDLAVGLTALLPYSEPAHRQTMLAYEQLGDRSSAMRQYRTLVRLLDDGLGVSPDDESYALYERLRRSQPVQSPQQLPEQVTTESGLINAASAKSPQVSSRPQRLVSVLALRHDEILSTSAGLPDHGSVVRRLGGEALLSHGAESIFVFGLDNNLTSFAIAALKAAMVVRDSSTAAQAPACACASGLIHIGADAYPVGSVIQRAARLALLADPGDLLVDRAILAQIPPQHEVEQVKLRNQIAYRLRQVQWQQCVSEQELFGRRVECAQLEQLLHDSVERGAAIAVVAAEAGMGKSHLMQRLELTARKKKNIVLRVAFSAHDVSPISITEQLTRALYDVLIEFDIVLDLDDVEHTTLLRLVQSGSHEPTLPSEDVLGHRYDLIIAMLNALSADIPILLIVEDCHWADKSDILLLLDIIDAMAKQPLLMIATERKEREVFASALAARVIECDVISLTLTPLSRRDALALVANRVKDDAVQQRILERGGGHPLFLTQLSHLDLETQTPVPVSVVALVQYELDRVSERAREACLMVSILGARFTMATVESLFPEIEREDLTSSRLLNRHGEYVMFDHALVHEAVYELVSTDVRYQLHTLAAEYFRLVNPGEYAWHALRCGDSSLAIEACCFAAERLLMDNRPADAERLVEHGIGLNADRDHLARLLLLKARLQRDQGELDKAVASAQIAFDNATEPGLKVRALVLSATLLKRRSDLDRASAQLRLASGIATRESLPSDIHAELEHEWGNNMFLRGEASKCLEHHLRARDIAKNADDRQMQATALGGLGDAYYVGGKPHSANRCFRDCVQLADANELPMIAIAHRAMAAFTAHMITPGRETLDADFQQAVDEAHRWRSASHEMMARLAFTETLIHARKIEQAGIQLSAMEALQERIGGDRYMPDQLYCRILWDWARGEENKAMQIAAQSVERFGHDPYMGPSFHAVYAALSADHALADKSLVAGEALLEQGCLLHNRVAYAEFASACHWRRGQPERALALIERTQAQFGAEPVGILQACIDWMRAILSDETTPVQVAEADLERQSLNLLATTHPPKFPAGIDGKNTVTASMLY